jgi:hypothetical protein
MLEEDLTRERSTRKPIYERRFFTVNIPIANARLPSP